MCVRAPSLKDFYGFAGSLLFRSCVGITRTIVVVVAEKEKLRVRFPKGSEAIWCFSSAAPHNSAWPKVPIYSALFTRRTSS